MTENLLAGKKEEVKQLAEEKVSLFNEQLRKQ
jgi:hypothetical protein